MSESKIDNSLVDEIRGKVFSETGSRISKDDPIMLNAHVIKAIFDLTIEDAKTIVSDIVCRDLDKIDQLVKLTEQKREQQAKSFTKQYETFIELFNDALQDQSEKEITSWKETNSMILNRIKTTQIVSICFNLLMVAIVIYLLAR